MDGLKIDLYLGFQVTKLKDVTNVSLAKKAFLDHLTLQNIKEFIREKNLMNVKFARRDLLNPVTLTDIKEFILEKNLLNVRFVLDALIHQVALRDIKEKFTRTRKTVQFKL